jgi:hypothetical protein
MSWLTSWLTKPEYQYTPYAFLLGFAFGQGLVLVALFLQAVSDKGWP